MKKPKDKYDFSRSSRSGKFGFETFQDEKEGLYYFHLNDREGKAFLFSQGYRDRKSRDNAIESVIKNAGNSDRYVKAENEAGNHFFLLRAGNNQEIARSRGFESRGAMNTALKVLDSVDEATSVENISRKTRSGKVKKSPATGTATQKEKLPRFRFTFTFYPDSEFWVLQHDFTGRSETIRDLDGGQIVSFIQDQLPAEILKQDKKLPGRPTEPARETEQPIVLKSKTGKSWSRIVKREDLYRAEIEVPDASEGGAVIARYDAKVFARSLEKKNELLIGEAIVEQFPNDGKIDIPLISSQLPTGPYRLTADVEINGKRAVRSSRIVALV